VEVGQAAEQQETAVERHIALLAASLALVVGGGGGGGGGMKEGCVVWACGCGQQVNQSVGADMGRKYYRAGECVVRPI
jgi:hypothetical protein